MVTMVTYLDSKVSGHTQSSEREEHENGNVDEQVGSAVETFEGLSELSQDVLSRHNDLMGG